MNQTSADIRCSQRRQLEAEGYILSRLRYMSQNEFRSTPLLRYTRQLQKLLTLFLEADTTGIERGIRDNFLEVNIRRSHKLKSSADLEVLRGSLTGLIGRLQRIDVSCCLLFQLALQTLKSPGGQANKLLAAQANCSRISCICQSFQLRYQKCLSQLESRTGGPTAQPPLTPATEQGVNRTDSSTANGDGTPAEELEERQPGIPSKPSVTAQNNSQSHGNQWEDQLCTDITPIKDQESTESSDLTESTESSDLTESRLSRKPHYMAEETLRVDRKAYMHKAREGLTHGKEVGGEVGGMDRREASSVADAQPCVSLTQPETRKVPNELKTILQTVETGKKSVPKKRKCSEALSPDESRLNGRGPLLAAPKASKQLSRKQLKKMERESEDGDNNCRKAKREDSRKAQRINSGKTSKVASKNPREGDSQKVSRETDSENVTTKKESGKASKITANNTREVHSGKASEIASENTKEVHSGKASKIASENTKQMHPGKASKIISENTKEMHSGKASKITSKNIKEMHFGKASKITSENTKQMHPGKASKIAPENTREVHSGKEQTEALTLKKARKLYEMLSQPSCSDKQVNHIENVLVTKYMMGGLVRQVKRAKKGAEASSSAHRKRLQKVLLGVLHTAE